MSQIWALMVLASTWMERVANSTPMVDLESRLNSLRVNRESRLDLPTPLSPMRTTAVRRKVSDRENGKWLQVTRMEKGGWGGGATWAVCQIPLNRN